MDYHSKDKSFIEKLSKNIMNEQLNMILKNTKKLLNNFNMNKKLLNYSFRNWTRSLKRFI